MQNGISCRWFWAKISRRQRPFGVRREGEGQRVDFANVWIRKRTLPKRSRILIEDLPVNFEFFRRISTTTCCFFNRISWFRISNFNQRVSHQKAIKSLRLLNRIITDITVFEINPKLMALENENYPI